MNLRELAKKYSAHDVWQEYCCFLDMGIDQYMKIQNRLMLEQIDLWSHSPLGQRFLGGKMPGSIDEFLKAVPVTTYEDYSDILLNKQTEMLPAEPMLWLETTWEGGSHPLKVAPYTKGMLETYSRNAFAILILCSSSGREKFELGKTILYGLAPLPFMTGLMAVTLKQDAGFEFLPPLEDALKMSFSERNKQGFKQGLKRDIDYFFGMGSVSYYVSGALSASSDNSKLKTALAMSPKVLGRYLASKKDRERENRGVLPKDLFRLKGFICAGTDNICYKEDLEKMWGVRPMEIFAGTESSVIGTETWNRKDLYFFPDTAFYEFLPEADIENCGQHPQTLKIDEVQPGNRYELIITMFKGGVFARYRTGDLYECSGIGSSEDETRLPRFRYIDRISSVIDIAGFTRITENSIKEVIELSGLKIVNWVAAKEFGENRHPYFHMYVEMSASQVMNLAVSKDILRKHMEIYFNYLDGDYSDLKRILGMDPLEITIVRCGAFEEYKSRFGRDIKKINPPRQQLSDLIKLQRE